MPQDGLLAAAHPTHPVNGKSPADTSEKLAEPLAEERLLPIE
jgi:hypothetical protein